MAERGDDNFMRYVYRGEEGEVIPRGAKIITVHESVTVIRARAFYEHDVVEVICHDNVEKIEWNAFWCCPKLRRVIMRGVTIVEENAFFSCEALTNVECGKLEIIEDEAFQYCDSLRSINLPSVRIVEMNAIFQCEALVDAIFGSKLERIEWGAFYKCTSLERISIPLRDGLITADNIFQGCEKLKYVDLVDGEGGLHETIAALHLEDWRNDMINEIYSINQILPTADAGYFDDYDDVDGEKAIAIRTWIRSVLEKMMHYKEEHRHLLEEDVAPTLQRFLPQDIVMNSLLPFLNLPSYTFEVGDHA